MKHTEREVAQIVKDEKIGFTRLIFSDISGTLNNVNGAEKRFLIRDTRI